MKNLAATVIALFTLTASAQDTAQVNPKTVKVKLDNARVRVLESTLPPGAREQMHSHPASIIYVLSGGQARSHTPDGKASEATFKAGDVVYREPVTHWVENIGKTTLHLIMVELKPEK